MSFEPSVTGIFSLDPAVPAANTRVEYGDDNLRNIKRALRWQFAGFAGDSAQVTVSPTELNYLSGVTSSVQTQLDAKLASADLTTAINALLTTAAINALDVDAATLNGESAYALLSSADFTALQLGGADVATEAYVDAAVSGVGGVTSSGWITMSNPLVFSGNNFTFSEAHGLGQVPDVIVSRLVCLSDDNGYQTGDVIMLASSDNPSGESSLQQITFQGTSTAIKIHCYNSVYFAIRATHATGASAVSLTNANWKLEAMGLVYS